MGTIQKLNILKINANNLKQKAVFLDRDGVINRLNPNGYIKDYKEEGRCSGRYKIFK